MSKKNSKNQGDLSVDSQDLGGEQENKLKQDNDLQQFLEEENSRENQENKDIKKKKEKVSFQQLFETKKKRKTSENQSNQEDEQDNENENESSDENSNESQQQQESQSQNQIQTRGKRLTRKNRGERNLNGYFNYREEEEMQKRKGRGKKKKKGKGKAKTSISASNSAKKESKKEKKEKKEKGSAKKEQGQQDRADQQNGTKEFIGLSQLNRIFNKQAPKLDPENDVLYKTSQLYENNFQNKVYGEIYEQEGLEEEQNYYFQQNEQQQQNSQKDDLENDENEGKEDLENSEKSNKQLMGEISEIQENFKNLQNNRKKSSFNGEKGDKNGDNINNKETPLEGILKKREISNNFENPDKESQKNMQRLQGVLNTYNKINWNNKQTYLNGNLKYLNFEYLTENVGSFDIIMADPPWRIKGGQGNDSQFMFSNCKFNLEYDTMSNQEIRDLKLEDLSRKGFMFLWILNTQMNVAYEMMNKWGYEVIDQIIWVKLKDKKVYLSHGYYFMHSFEICLVGFKCPPGEHVEYISKISNNILFAEVRKKSQKPDEIYELIELLMPGSKKIELFARNHNLRPGWFSIGNQLGELYEKWNQTISCDECEKVLEPGIKRYKSKQIANHDLCEECFSKPGNNQDEFLFIENKVDEDILHAYHKCDHCQIEPIWGIRFECQEEGCNHDYCEQCLDKNISLEKDLKFHDINHELKVVEVPKFADGFPVHAQKKCQACQKKPIIGVCFTCKQCQNFNICQQCFFSKAPHELAKGNRGHKLDHKLESIFEPQIDNYTKIKYKCNGCGLENLCGDVYQCENCFQFYFCKQCYLTKRDDFKTMMATSHKNYHQFTKLFVAN